MRGVAQARQLILAVAVGIIWWSTSVYAGDWTQLPTVASFAQGQAITAAANQPEATFSNPALLTTLSRNFSGSSVASFYGSQMSVYNFYATKRFKNMGIGVNIPLKQITDIPKTVADNNNIGTQIGSFSDTQIAAQLSLATMLSNAIHIGLSTRLESQNLLTESATGYAVDAGIVRARGQLAVALSAHNIVSQKTWTTGRKETLNRYVKMGVSADVFDYSTVLLDATYDNKSISSINTGMNTRLGQHLTVMGGINDVTHTPKWAAGLVLDIESFQLRYGLSTAHVLGTTHKLGVSLVF